MSDISRLAKTLMKLDDKLADCMRCGLCQAVCPVFGVTHKEGDVTRGKLALLDNLAHKIIQDPDAVEERLNRCLLCGSCQANCPPACPSWKSSSRPVRPSWTTAA